MELSSKLESYEAATTLAAFQDLAHISPWAKSSMAVCVKTGLVSGKGDKMLAPGAYTTRAETVVLIRRLLDML